MHCFAISAPNGRDTWELRRSIEVIGYHRYREEVQILFLLYGENKCKDNCLRMMHRGNVECCWLPSWPLPRHPSEKPTSVEETPSILGNLYGEAFELVDGGLFRVKTLLPWDSWETIKPRIVHPWRPSSGSPRMAGASEDMLISPEFPHPRLDEYVPFTSWRIGNFMEPGLFLMTFAMRFSGETYRRLVGRQTQFTVDGPQRVLTRTKYEVLNREDHKVWTKRLALFESESVFSDKGYDIIVLNRSLADEVETFAPSGMVQAPRQPENGSRFITLSHEFTMWVRYAEPKSGLPGQPPLWSDEAMAVTEFQNEI
jgi:hypothetical protein